MRELGTFQGLCSAPQPWLTGTGSEINQGDDLEAQGEMLLVLLSKFPLFHTLPLAEVPGWGSVFRINNTVWRSWNHRIL